MDGRKTQNCTHTLQVPKVASSGANGAEETSNHSLEGGGGEGFQFSPGMRLETKRLPKKNEG